MRAAGERTARQTGRRAAPAAELSASEAALRDLQSLLSAAVQRLRPTTGCERALAWALRPNGEPYVAAAAFGGAAPLAPTAQEFAAAAALPGARDLAERSLSPALRALAHRHRCAAAAPVSTGTRAALAVLLVGPDGGSALAAARPRTLAALEAAARRLAGPLSAALALGRLAQLDAEVRRLDRLAALGSLAAEVAHEVRNPLVSVKTFLQLLPERGDDPEFLTRFIEVASDELRRTERLLDLVIEQTRPVRSEVGAASVPAVLEAVEELLRVRALARGVRLDVSAEPRPARVAVGEDALRQVLLNLALNAIEVTPSGGTVRLAARAEEGGVELVVEDEGPGIPEGLRARILEPFVSTRREGTGGLGLAITRRIVEEAGGAISVGERVGGGAQFRVQLPADDVAS